VVVEGSLNLRIGDQKMVVTANQTISVPARTPHAFTAGPNGAKFIAFIPKQGAHLATEYLEGGPAAGAALK
jgi:quercetin dioxygenase-like cupin family protein